MSRLSSLLIACGAACAVPGDVPAWVDGPSSTLLTVEADLGVARAMLGNALRVFGHEPVRTHVLRLGHRKRRARVTATGPHKAPLQFELVEKRSPGRPILTTLSLVGAREVPPAPIAPQRGAAATRLLEESVAWALGLRDERHP